MYFGEGFENGLLPLARRVKDDLIMPSCGLFDPARLHD